MSNGWIEGSWWRVARQQPPRTIVLVYDARTHVFARQARYAFVDRDILPAHCINELVVCTYSIATFVDAPYGARGSTKTNDRNNGF